MNKRALHAAIIARLDAELATMTRSALESYADATDEQNKAENKYDTRGLEASYLARGQSKAVEQAAEALSHFNAVPLHPVAAGTPIALGALVALADSAAAANTSWYFIGPAAGGTEVVEDGTTVLVVTPSSPLGRQLLGHRVGDTLTIDRAGRRREFRIVAVE